MQSAAKKLPDDVETLQSLLLAAFEQNEALREEDRRFHARVGPSRSS
jgi:DNA-binding protein YbaB